MQVYELVDTVPLVQLGQVGLTSIQDIVQQPGGDIYALASRMDQQVQLYQGDVGALFARVAPRWLRAGLEMCLVLRRCERFAFPA